MIGKKLLIIADPKDESFRDELYKNLKPLPLEIWHEGLRGIGDDIAESSKQRMDTADIILLLISADFLASDTISEKDLPLALKRHVDDKSKVIPIITRSCNWQQLEKLTQMPLILPIKDGTVGTAISSWDNVDDAYSMIVKEIQNF